MPVTANVDISLYFSGLSIPHTAKVVKRLEHDLILGADFLSQNHVIIDYKENMVSIADDLVRVPLQSLQNKEDYVTTISSTCIPAFSEATIPVDLQQQYNNKTVLLEPSKHFQFRQFATARSLSNCQNGKTVCTVLNYNPQTLVLKKGIKIATLENIDTLQSCIPYVEKKTRSSVAAVLVRPEDTDTRADLDKFLEEYKFHINNKDITEEQKYELLTLLRRYKDVFARSLEEIKQYPHYELHLDLLSDRKVFRSQFRLHPDDATEAQRQIDEMYQAGVIEHAPTVDYNSPIFLVAKKDASKRLVIDLRGINQLVAPRLVQLPKINELIDSVTSSKCKHFSVCDLRSGYFQIKLQKRITPIDSFYSP